MFRFGFFFRGYTSAIYQLKQWGSTTLSYDMNGNLINDGAGSYRWNARNQLGALGGLSFAYDASGRRT